MTKLFGTDGIRGVANVDLTPRIAYDLGRATAHRITGRDGRLLIGQDTRRSSDMFVAAVAAGAMSMGADVHRLGVCPTPALAHVTAAGHFNAGVMVSASHNPAADNGLKVFDGDGLKLEDALEDELEDADAARRRAGGPGQRRPRPSTRCACTCSTSTSGIGPASPRGPASTARIVLDCANGSAGVVAPQILAATGADSRRPLQRARRLQHQPRLRRDRTAALAAIVKRDRRATSASRSTATRTAASRSTSAARSSTATS